ncbi:single-stranded DNA-binding protein [Candidatus Parcubacteria bacterium]|nr:MAG: single-stranded DNA-binding protein [Candidatus Parcubacteria bacterium]
MSNLNKVILIGRPTRDPEVRTFTDGGKLVTFRFAVNNRRKNKDTGEYEDNAVFIDCKANNRGTRKLADTVEKYVFKGKLLCLEGHLVLDEWTGKEDGKNHQALRVAIDDLHFIDSKKDTPVSEPPFVECEEDFGVDPF